MAYPSHNFTASIDLLKSFTVGHFFKCGKIPSRNFEVMRFKMEGAGADPENELGGPIQGVPQRVQGRSPGRGSGDLSPRS